MNQKVFEIIYQNNKLRAIWGENQEFTCVKVLSNEQTVEPTNEELLFLMNEIKKKLANKEKEEFITKDININAIKNLINTGKLNSFDDIKKYIYSLNISEKEKEELLKEAYKYFEGLSTEKTPITIFKDKLIEELRKNKSKDTALAVTFNIRENVTGIDNCEVTLNRYNQNGITEVEKQTFDYTEEAKKELIEPVLEELVLSSEVEPVTKKPVPGGIYRTNMRLNTYDNRIANLYNIEDGYANDLEKHINELSQEAKINNNYERDEKLSELQNEKNDNLTRKRVINNKEDYENKGFSNTYLIYAIISLITTILIIFKMFLIS